MVIVFISFYNRQMKQRRKKLRVGVLIRKIRKTKNVCLCKLRFHFLNFSGDDRDELEKKDVKLDKEKGRWRINSKSSSSKFKDECICVEVYYLISLGSADLKTSDCIDSKDGKDRDKEQKLKGRFRLSSKSNSRPPKSQADQFSF